MERNEEKAKRSRSKERRIELRRNDGAQLVLCATWKDFHSRSICMLSNILIVIAVLIFAVKLD